MAATRSRLKTKGYCAFQIVYFNLVYTCFCIVKHFVKHYINKPYLFLTKKKGNSIQF